jgi:5-methyltetrahydropteroyltriglutamate--homocysteine methyltransferase
MDWSDRHSLSPDASFDGGDLDCGNGLLLLIRRHIDPLAPGQLLEIRSTEPSVEEDLPAWSRLTGNELVSRTKRGDLRSYLVRKKGLATLVSQFESPTLDPKSHGEERDKDLAGSTIVDPPIRPLAVMGIGSWPRPGWLLRALHDRLTGRLPEDEFEIYADNAVRLAIAAQERAGVDVVTDGEQRRDNYASFVGARLDNCQLIPVTDLLPYVDDPNHFAEELKALDVPAEQVRHPAVFGRMRRTRPLAVHELHHARRFTNRPIKVALPGPYLLTRTMWLECVSDKAYPDREELSADVVAVLRQEAKELLAAGAAMVQFDEPVLTEVVFARTKAGRSFMCGALGAKRNPDEELDFAGRLIRDVVAGLPQERLGLHVCRGNWSRDETVALSGPYTPLVPLFRTLPIGTFFLESATPRAGDLAPLSDLPIGCRIGVGVVNQKLDYVESLDEVLARAESAIRMFGANRVLLNPDCGFATFADNPIASADVAEQKLATIVRASRVLRDKCGVG